MRSSSLFSDADRLIQETEMLIASQDPFAAAAKGIVPALAVVAEARFQATEQVAKSPPPAAAAFAAQVQPAQPSVPQQAPTQQQQSPSFNFNSVSNPPYMNPFAQNSAMRFPQQQTQISQMQQQGNAPNRRPNNFSPFQQQQQTQPNWQGGSFNPNGGMPNQQRPSGFGMQSGAAPQMNPQMGGQMRMMQQQQQQQQYAPTPQPTQRAKPKARETPAFDAHPTDFKNSDGVPAPMFVDLGERVTVRLTGPEREVMSLETQYRGASGILDHNSVAGQGSAMPPGMSYGMDESLPSPSQDSQGALPHGESDPAAAEFSFRQNSVSISDKPEGKIGEGMMHDMDQMYQQSQMREPAAQKGVLQPFNSPMSPEAKPAIARPSKESRVNQEQMTEIEKAMSWEKTHPNFMGSDVASPQIRMAEQQVETGNAEEAGNAEDVEQMEAQLSMGAEPVEAESAGMPQFLRGSSAARAADGAQQASQQHASASTTTFGYAHSDDGQKGKNSDGGGAIPAYDNTHPAAPEQMQGY